MKQLLRFLGNYCLNRKRPLTCKTIILSLLIASTIPVAQGQDERNHKVHGGLITTDAQSQCGMLGVHRVNDNYYLEIPDSLLDRDILVVNRLASGWAGEHPYDPFLNTLGYAGDLANEMVFRFQQVFPGRICVQPALYGERVSNHDGHLRQPPHADLLPTIASFTVHSRNPADDASLINATAFLQEDNTISTFSKTLREKFRIGGYQPQYSGLLGISVEKQRLAIRSRRAYTGSRGEGVTVELHATWFLLPATPMKARQADYRVGYMTTDATGYTDQTREPEKIRLVNRWRMNPSPADREAYFSGQLVEPENPIVFYIDPAFPEEWMPYIISGVNDWQAAFEQAGFRNAISAERAPADDPDWIVGDARYSVICYKPSRVTNARGDIVADPRSGEIIHAQVSWHHGMIAMVRRWALVQGAATLSGARGPQPDTAILGRMIRSIVCHEVGHTLGLLHNFGASATVPVERLRDKEWLAVHPLSPSVMDYVRLNYVAQPEDGIAMEHQFPRVGAYDKWAVEWAYRCQPETGDPERDRQLLDQWTASRQAEPMLWYGAEDRQDSDPRCQAEDLGDDPLAAGAYGIQNLQYLLDSLPLWVPNSYDAGLRYKDIIRQYAAYLNRATDLVGVSDGRTDHALAFLNRHFFNPPLWLLDNGVARHANIDPLESLARTKQELVERLVRKTAGSAASLLQDRLQAYVFTRPERAGAITAYRRSLQRAYVEQLVRFALPEKDGKPQLPDEAQAGALAALQKLVPFIRDARRRTNDPASRIHMESLLRFLTQYQITERN